MGSRWLAMGPYSARMERNASRKPFRQVSGPKTPLKNKKAAKVLKNFSTENEAFVVKGGLMDEEPLTIEQLNVLASIDSRDVLLAKIAGGFNAPVTKLAGTIKGVLNKSGYAFKALLEKKESTGEINSESEESEASDEAKEDIKKEEE